jgi:hypothetical protein
MAKWRSMRARGATGLPLCAQVMAVVGTLFGCSYSWVHPGDGTPPGGCSPSAPCPSGQICRYPDFACGLGKTGSCEPIESTCQDDTLHTYCSCGEDTTGFCMAEAMGRDLAVCTTAPAFTFACGYVFCSSAEYCIETLHPGARSTYACEIPPGLCVPDDCSCVIGDRCSCSTPNGSGAIYVCTP